MISLLPFAHRKNSDGSIDSICTMCFQTIATEDSEGKLIAHEERHLCDPNWQFSPSSPQGAKLKNLPSSWAAGESLMPAERGGTLLTGSRSTFQRPLTAFSI